MAQWSMQKTANVTNPKNVLVQIPGCITAKWQLQLGDKLEVKYDEETNIITIRPTVRSRGNTISKS